MQEEIDKIIAWAAKWKMKVNADKTKSMVISSSSSDRKWDPQLTADSKLIDQVQLYKFLGVTINSDLWFRSHVETIVDRWRKRNRVLKCMAENNLPAVHKTST